MPGRFATFFTRQSGGSGLAALQTAAPSEFYGCRIFAIILTVLDLTGGDIDDQLAELDRVARAR
jgi:hypothetical protein